MKGAKHVKDWQNAVVRNNDIQVVFAVHGSAIRDAIADQVEVHVVEVTKRTAELQEVCKRRDLTVGEVLEAETEEQVSLYSGKASNSIRSHTSVVVRELQEDLGAIRHLSGLVQARKALIDKLLRVARNLSGTDSYKLTYAELELFGL